MLYDKLGEEFPKRRQKKLVNIGVDLSSKAPESKLATSELVQFYKEEENALVQVGEHLLSVNQLRPYGLWEDFRGMIERVFKLYLQTANPSSLARIGLRYINVVELDAQHVELEEFFKFRPNFGDSLPTEYSGFISGVETPFEGGRDLQRLVLTLQGRPTPTSTSILLDIDYGLVRAEEVTLDDALKWVETAHGYVETTFESCITDALRKMFEQEGQ